MGSVVYDEDAQLAVVLCERIAMPACVLSAIDIVVVHFYVELPDGSSDHINCDPFRPRKPHGRPLQLNWCSFLVVDALAQATLKLTVADLEGNHLGVWFGALQELAASSKFKVRELSLRNVDGEVATITVHAATQVRWTYDLSPLRQRSKCQYLIANEDAQAGHIWSFLFPDRPPPGRPVESPVSLWEQASEKSSQSSPLSPRMQTVAEAPSLASPASFGACDHDDNFLDSSYMHRVSVIPRSPKREEPKQRSREDSDEVGPRLADGGSLMLQWGSECERTHIRIGKRTGSKMGRRRSCSGVGSCAGAESVPLAGERSCVRKRSKSAGRRALASASAPSSVGPGPICPWEETTPTQPSAGYRNVASEERLPQRRRSSRTRSDLRQSKLCKHDDGGSKSEEGCEEHSVFGSEEAGEYEQPVKSGQSHGLAAAGTLPLSRSEVRLQALREMMNQRLGASSEKGIQSPLSGEAHVARSRPLRQQTPQRPMLDERTPTVLQQQEQTPVRTGRAGLRGVSPGRSSGTLSRFCPKETAVSPDTPFALRLQGQNTSPRAVSASRGVSPMKPDDAARTLVESSSSCGHVRAGGVDNPASCKVTSPPRVNAPICSSQTQGLPWSLDHILSQVCSAPTPSCRVRLYRVLTSALAVRIGPDVCSARTGAVLMRGDIFEASVVAPGVDGRVYLKLAGARGWVFDDSAVDPVDPSVEPALDLSDDALVGLREPSSACSSDRGNAFGTFGTFGAPSGFAFGGCRSAASLTSGGSDRSTVDAVSMVAAETRAILSAELSQPSSTSRPAQLQPSHLSQPVQRQRCISGPVPQLNSRDENVPYSLAPALDPASWAKAAPFSASPVLLHQRDERLVKPVDYAGPSTSCIDSSGRSWGSLPAKSIAPEVPVLSDAFRVAMGGSVPRGPRRPAPPSLEDSVLFGADASRPPLLRAIGYGAPALLA